MAQLRPLDKKAFCYFLKKENIYIKYLRNLKYNIFRSDPLNYVSGAFNWNSTEEGKSYWKKVNAIWVRFYIKLHSTINDYTKIFHSKDLTRLKYGELHDFAVRIQNHKNTVSQYVNDNLLHFLEYNKFQFLKEMRESFKDVIPSSFISMR